MQVGPREGATGDTGAAMKLRSTSPSLKAIGFDLFNTLVTVEPQALTEAVDRLRASLQDGGLDVDGDAFRYEHRQAALEFIEEARRTGRETHNRFWIGRALQRLGHAVPPDDPRIGMAVEHYFSAFGELSRLVPGTLEMLEILASRYRLGLLSNFTHAPAARAILDRLGLAPFFSTVLISGDLGYRKPHPGVFERLARELGASKEELIYVGDDPEPDVDGAMDSGIRPVWTTYVRDRDIALAPGVASRQTEGPRNPAERISRWDDLLALLDGPLLAGPS